MPHSDSSAQVLTIPAPMTHLFSLASIWTPVLVQGLPIQYQLFPNPGRLPKASCPIVDHSGGADLPELLTRTPKLHSSFSKTAAFDPSEARQDGYSPQGRAKFLSPEKHDHSSASQPTKHLAISALEEESNDTEPSQESSCAAAFRFIATGRYIYIYIIAMQTAQYRY